jgi:hypothetical protein
LVLDGSRLLPWTVRRLVPAGVEIEIAASSVEALQMLRDHPPDAAIVNVDPGGPPWREIGRLCLEMRPPIPVLFESNVFRSAAEACIELRRGAAFLPSSARTPELRGALALLLAGRDILEGPEGESPAN